MSVRNPRYTGQNRCWPCTAVNILIVTIAAAAATLAGYSVVAGAVIVSGIGATALRGYAIPGTPRLARELPTPVLAWFGKAGDDPVRGVLQTLQAAGVLEDAPPESGRSFSLGATVREPYEKRARAHAKDQEGLERALIERFDGVEHVSVTRSLGGGGHWFGQADAQNTVRQWESRALAAMDAAAAAVLADRVPDWGDLDPTTRTQSLALFRLATDTCPDCVTALEVGDGPTVSCCGGRSLTGALRCPACDYPVVDVNDLPETDLASPRTDD